jgi:hypothetical protein
MKLNVTPGAKMPEAAFSSAIVVLLLIPLPLLGGVTMLIAAACALAAYLSIYPERVRTAAGHIKPAARILIAFASAAAVAFAFYLARWHW